MPWPTVTELFVHSTAGVLLCSILVDDLRNYRIRNTKVLELAGLFLAWCLIKGDLSLLLSHVGVAFVIFIILALMYHFGMMGGGDVKLLTIAFLWHGLEHGSLFSVLLCVTSVGYVVIAQLNWVPSRKHDSRINVPFGPSIAAAWIATMFVTQAPTILS